MNTPSIPSDSPSLRLAVFDCDGTLVDSQHAIIDAMCNAFTAHGLDHPDDHSVRRIVGLPLVEGIARLRPDLDNAAHESLREGYREHFLRLRDAGSVEEPLYPGVVDCLEGLEQSGWLLGVATGKARRGLDLTLGGHGLMDQFVTLQTADVAHGKPHPDMMLRAMAETGAEASRSVMIGDTTYDMEMAVNAGTMAIGVAWGYHETVELQAAGAHVVVTSYGELKDVLDDIF